MKNTLLVVADLGGYKAFKIEPNEQPNRAPRLELLEEYDNGRAHDRLVDMVSDLAGRFPRAGGGRPDGAMSAGERHNIELETRRRLVRELAQRINQLARAQEVERCMLAASREINTQLVDELESRVRSKIVKNISADLTKVERGDILRHF